LTAINAQFDIISVRCLELPQGCRRRRAEAAMILCGSVTSSVGGRPAVVVYCCAAS